MDTWPNFPQEYHIFPQKESYFLCQFQRLALVFWLNYLFKKLNFEEFWNC